MIHSAGLSCTKHISCQVSLMAGREGIPTFTPDNKTSCSYSMIYPKLPIQCNEGDSCKNETNHFSV